MAHPAMRTSARAIRPELASLSQRENQQTTPDSPRTPRTPILNRGSSSNVNSPGNLFRSDDDVFIFEFGTRFLRAGLGGESSPRCILDFSPAKQHRAGDYSHWSPGYTAKQSKQADELASWGREYELWPLDLRNVDFGLIRDKIERALRDALVSHLLVLDDLKRRRFTLILPSLFPQPLLSLLLKTLFDHFPPPQSITLLPSSLVCTVAAGLRSALVVDIGWSETIVSAVYDYREVHTRRSCRSMKLLSWKMRQLLIDELEAQSTSQDDTPSRNTRPSFEDVEETIARMAWCRYSHVSAGNSSENDDILVPISGSKGPLPVSFQRFSNPTEQAFFATDEESNWFDDHEIPLPLLVFRALLDLPIDVRRTCLTRIILTGGGGDIPGLKSRLIRELRHIIGYQGWNSVERYGSASAKLELKRVKEEEERRESLVPIEEEPEEGPREEPQAPANKDMDPASTTPTYLQPQLPDKILTSIQSKSDPSNANNSPIIVEPYSDGSVTHGAIQVVSTAGAWAGASLITGLKVKGLVEIERDHFLRHGLSGPERAEADKRKSTAAAQQRQSLVGAPATTTGKPGDRHSGTWSLGVWA